jgi:hypothetical protein
MCRLASSTGAHASMQGQLLRYSPTVNCAALLGANALLSTDLRHYVYMQCV